MDTDRRLRQEIAQVMQEKRISQAQLARKLGVKPQSIYPVLRGARGKQPQSLLAILDALGLELTVRAKPEPLDAEAQAWLQADLLRLSEQDPYDWQPGELEDGEALSLGRG
jgi:transcriptional regulator with XRE-family HTH domain